MKVLVTYWSQTGNTRKIAEVIFRSLSCEKDLKNFEEVGSLEGYDLTFIGFPVSRFRPAPSAREFISKHAKGRKIALFVTHGIPAESIDPLQKAILEKELEKCRQICTGAKLLGLYHCQGEISEKMANELRDSNIPMLIEFARMQSSTKGHPNPEEFRMAAVFVKEIISLVTMDNP